MIPKSVKRLEPRPGMRFNRWTVDGPVFKRISELGNSVFYFPCICLCGTRKDVERSNLQRGKTTSCGCHRDEIVSKTWSSEKKTGRRIASSGSRTHKYWSHLKKHAKKYDISFDERWKDYLNFYTDAGARPFNHNLVRLDPSLGFTPENCLWKPQSQRERHGMTGSLTYNAWCSMRRSCRASKKKYVERWNYLELFLQDLGEAPTERPFLNLIDKTGIFEPSNCTWGNKMMSIKPLASHCKRGHAFVPGSFYDRINADGHRVRACKACAHFHNVKSYEKIKTAANIE